MPTPTIRITETLRLRMSASPPYVATRVLEVSFENYDAVPSEQDVLTAVDNSGHPDAVERVPQAGDVHPRSVDLVCKGPNLIECKGPFYFVVQCDYDAQGGAPLAGTINPLSLPPQYTWTPLQYDAESDTDAGGRLICDSAGNVIRQSRPYAVKGLRVVKWVRAFDTAWWDMELSVNATAVNVDGITVAAEHMLYKSATPSPYYKNAWTALEVAWDFECVLTDKLLGVSAKPWCWRILDAGRAGWYSDSGTKKKLDFSDGKGNLFTDDVYLGGDGRPLSPVFSYVAVGPQNKTATTPPSSFPPYFQDTGTVYPNAVFRYFEKYPRKNHASLPIW